MQDWGPIDQAFEIHIPECHVVVQQYQPLRGVNNNVPIVSEDADMDEFNGGDGGATGDVKNCPICTFENS